MHHHRSSEKKKAGAKADRKPLEKRSVKNAVQFGDKVKADRLNLARQQRDNKRAEIMERKRLGAYDGPSPPKIVVLVPFHSQADCSLLKNGILKVTGYQGSLAPHEAAVTILPPWAQGERGKGKQRIQILDPARDLTAVLDAAKVADMIIAVFGPTATLDAPSFDELGYKMLTALKNQGLPTVVGAMHRFGDVMASTKQQVETKKLITRYFTSEFGSNEKICAADTDEEIKMLVRSLGNLTPKELTWRNNRGYLVASQVEYSPVDQVLCLRGYVRGVGLSCKYPVHLTGLGDFVLSKIALMNDPCPVKAQHAVNKDDEMAGERILEELTKEMESGLDMDRLQPYDPTEEEQTWPTGEELAEAKAHRAKNRKAPGTVAVHQNADDMDDVMEGIDCTEVPVPESDEENADSDADMAEVPGSDEDNETDVGSVNTDLPPTAEAVMAERRRRAVLEQRSAEDLEFPDEVDTPLETPARQRFQKFRGLKSFRTSSWDPYEELPVEYGRIWEFEGFEATVRHEENQFAEDAYKLNDEKGVSSHFCALYLRGVPPDAVASQPGGRPFVLSNLFPSERKVSVVHSTLTRLPESKEPIKSKTDVTLHCGFRRLSARPIFSEIPKRHTISKKYKFERFFHADSTVQASFYSPVIFPPCPISMFVDTQQIMSHQGPQLAAWGSITGSEPKRLIIKRVVLTGYPVKTHKSKAVVRYMFFNATDIAWFKPVELHTKHGARGHIRESRGTHGLMKCRFNNYVKGDDTVCMALYKRVFPKWFPPSWGGRSEDGPENAPCK